METFSCLDYKCSPAFVKLLVLVLLSSVPTEESLNHFGYCFFSFYPASLSLIFCGSYQVVISFLQRHITFCFLSVTLCEFFWEFWWGYIKREDSWHGWIQIFSGKPCMGCVCVRAHVFSGNIVKLCSSRSSTFQFSVLQMAQQLWIISVSLYLIAARFLNRNCTSAIKEKVTMFQLYLRKF